jgi:ABC-2 type transport system permease protein
VTGLRVFFVGLRFHVKALTHSVFFLLTSIFMPLLVATVAYYMYRAGNQSGGLLYSLVSTLVWGRLAFGIPFHVAHWLAFVVAVPATILGLGLLGFAFASTFVLYRSANALSNMLEWPVLLVTGMLVPLSLLPGWAGPIAWLLAPTWGVQAIREAALGGTPWPDIGVTIGLGLVYLAIGAVCLRHFETAARRHATLSLT